MWSWWLLWHKIYKYVYGIVGTTFTSSRARAQFLLKGDIRLLLALRREIQYVELGYYCISIYVNHKAAW